MENRKISVAIATYNGEKFLPQLLDSIGGQSLLPEEIVFSDDNSTDSTLEVVHEFKRKSNIKILVLKSASQVGVIENFKRAFSVCSGDYIAYCDQDDYWKRTKIERYAGIIARRDYSLVYHRSQITNEVLESTETSMPSNITGGAYNFPHFPDHIWGYGHQMLFSAKILPMIGRLIGHASDENLEAVPISGSFDRVILIAAGMSGDIFYIDEDLMLFRRHRNSVSAAGKETAFKGNLDLRAAAIQQNVIYVTKLLAHMDEFYGDENKDRDLTKRRYRAHLEKMLCRLNERLILYRKVNMARKLGALGRLIWGGNYGEMQMNKVPPKTMLRDVIYMLGLAGK
jgi:glycosyltransferase involved in cell wall biosynthesis